jgi:ribonuclease BN (tRNA processing enzyme)
LLPLLQTLDLDGRRNHMVVMGPSTRQAIDWAIQHPGEAPPVDSGISSTDLAILFSQWQAIGTKDEDSSYTIDWVLLPIEDDTPFKSPIQPLEGVTLTIVPTHHGVPSCGYHFETNRKQGRFDRERAKGLNLSVEQIGQLAEGQDLIVNDESLTAASFRGESRPGCSLMVSGDTAHGPIGFDAANLPSSPQLLLHEATFLAEKQDKATQYYHSTAADAARHATSCKASTLALTHYSSRIERLSPMVSEAREHFEGGVAATLDGDWFGIDANGDVSHHVRIENGWNKKNL